VSFFCQRTIPHRTLEISNINSILSNCYAKDFFEKKSSPFLKHRRVSSARYTRLDTLLVLVTSSKKRYSIVFSSSPQKTLKRVQLNTGRQKERCFSTVAPMVPTAAERAVQNERAHFGRLSHCDGFCLFVFLCQFEVSLLLSFSKESR